MTTRIAMVCLGNICRSPMSEVVCRTLAEQAGLASEVVVESFGTAGYHEGEGPDPQAAAALRRAGWPTGEHRARRIRTEDLGGLDLILCADRGNLANVRRLIGAGTSSPEVGLLRSYDPDASESDDEVPDPWGRPDAEFDRTLSIIERACRGLVAAVAGELL